MSPSYWHKTNPDIKTDHMIISALLYTLMKDGLGRETCEKIKYFAGISSLFGTIYHKDIMSRVNSIDGVTLTNANQTGIGLDLQSLDF